MTKTSYVKCPHLQANPEKFDHSNTWRERLSNKRVFMGCHSCLKASIEEEWSKTEVGRARVEHLRRVDLVEVRGSTIYAPEGLLKHVVEPVEMPNGEVVMMPGWRINGEYGVAAAEAPAAAPVPETAPKPETPEPDAAELWAFLAPIVAANEKFVGLWREGKTGPLIGAARKAAVGKYEGKHIEKTLKEIVDGRPL